MSFAPSDESFGDRDPGEHEHDVDHASTSQRTAQRPTPTMVDPILVERPEDAPPEGETTGADAGDAEGPDARDADVSGAVHEGGDDPDAAAADADGADAAAADADADAAAADADENDAEPTDAQGADAENDDAASDDADGDDADREEVDGVNADVEADAELDVDADAELEIDADAESELEADVDGEPDAGVGDEPERERGDGSEAAADAAGAEAEADDAHVTEPATEPEAEPGATAASTAPRRPERDLRFGVATAAGLSTMTPVARVTEAPHRELGEPVLQVEGLTKTFGSTVAVRDVSLEVRKGSFFGIVGPNGAGKTTTLSMVTGLLRPTSGSATVLGVDVWRESSKARAHIGILPDRLRLFDQLTGAQLLYYTGVLRGLPTDEARARAASLIEAFELGRSANRLVVDYSAGMTKKVALASALIHSPELLVLDEPFESIDPVSAGQLTDILFEYVDRGGTVMLSSHSMDLVQRVCDHVAVIVDGEILAEGTVSEVRGDVTLEERFRDIVRGPRNTEGLDWLGISFS